MLYMSCVRVVLDSAIVNHKYTNEQEEKSRWVDARVQEADVLSSIKENQGDWGGENNHRYDRRDVEERPEKALVVLTQVLTGRYGRGRTTGLISASEVEPPCIVGGCFGTATKFPLDNPPSVFQIGFSSGSGQGYGRVACAMCTIVENPRNMHV